MKKPRVVITGIGMVTPLGNSAGETWAALRAGASGVGLLSRFDCSAYPTRIAGEVKSFDPRAFMSAKEAHRTDPFIRYALAASVMAMDDAGLTAVKDPERTGVLVGSGRGGVTTAEKNMQALLAKGPRSVSPFFTPLSLVNMASALISIRYGARGPCLDVSTACATGTHAVGEALRIIQRGEADVMIAGGAEAALTPLVLAGFCQARALSTRNERPAAASRPFDRGRDGFVLAEGAAVLVLEELTSAERRDARIYAEVAGYGITSDAYHMTLPDRNGEGSARAMLQALADAGTPPEQIGYINAHGTSTVPNDAIETRAIKAVFGERGPAVSSTKSMLGHMLGAAGAVEAAVCALALHDGIIPPTINLDDPDPACQLDHVAKRARTAAIRWALSNSLGFGGMNAAIVLRKP